MKTVIITGPSGSGKTYLSNKLSKLFDNSIVIKTDSYYRDNIIIKFLSIFLYDIYDRIFSIKKYEIKKTLRSINKKDKLISLSQYNFKRKISSHSEISINYKGDNQLIILEGIFAHRLDLNYQETINIICIERKETCFKRRLLRDQIERGRKKEEINKRFNRSWFLFYRRIVNFLYKNKVLFINPCDQISCDKLVIYLQKMTKK